MAPDWNVAPPDFLQVSLVQDSSPADLEGFGVLEDQGALGHVAVVAGLAGDEGHQVRVLKYEWFSFEKEHKNEKQIPSP